MAKEWIENLAQVKQKNHEAAKDFGRAQHQAAIVTNLGAPSFAASLQQNITELLLQT